MGLKSRTGLFMMILLISYNGKLLVLYFVANINVVLRYSALIDLSKKMN